MARFGGEPDECAPGQVAAVARALNALDRAGFAVPEPVLAAYVEHLAAIGEAELEATPADSAEEAVRYVVLGTVLVEPLILALRRVAEQMAASRRFGAAEPSGQRCGFDAAPSSHSVSVGSLCVPPEPTWVALIRGPFVMTCTRAMP